MDLLLKKTSVDNVKRHILPMIITSLEADNTQLQVRSGALEVRVHIIHTFSNLGIYTYHSKIAMSRSQVAFSAQIWEPDLGMRLVT